MLWFCYMAIPELSGVGTEPRTLGKLRAGSDTKKTRFFHHVKTDCAVTSRKRHTWGGVVVILEALVLVLAASALSWYSR